MADEKRLHPATLDWGDDERESVAPRSVVFDDIYFSGDGPTETTHVFLSGNNLPTRFQSAGTFSIGELGFGAGLNFLCAWDCWRNTKKSPQARLSFFSVEAFPLTPTDLSRAHQRWPQISELSDRLIAAYPPMHLGFHHLHLDDDVSLTLFFGDAHDGLSQAEAAIDAWFLDGFSPAKNPEMWRAALIEEVARLSNPHATFATFTVAGTVRRALQSAGFDIEKRPGFGAKRNMLAGRLTKQSDISRRKAWYATRQTPSLKPGARIAIIGAGVAGAAIAHALRRTGMDPIVLEAKTPASGASGNPAGMIMPRLDAGDTPDAVFHAAAYLYTDRLIRKLQEQTCATFFVECGAILHAETTREKNRQQKLKAMQALPEEWMVAHEDGLFFPKAGVINPSAFVKALLGETPVHQREVTQLQALDNSWRVDFANGESEAFDAVVIANGLDALRFAQCHSLPLAGAAGQIDYFPDAKMPEHIRMFGAYAAPCPQFNGGHDTRTRGQTTGLVIGATYAPIEIGNEPAFTPEATRSNINAVHAVLPDLANTLDPATSIPRASIRCVTPDWMPVAGPMPDWGFYAGAYDGLRDGRLIDYPAGETLPSLYILSGLGSRGLVTAPLAAAMIATEIAGAPSPVDHRVAEALHPARFFIRRLRKTKPG